MAATTTTKPTVIDQGILTPVVRRALDSETAQVTEWQVVSLQGGAGDLGAGLIGVSRVTGKAKDQGETKPWSLILKVIRASDSAADPTTARYWAREPLAYQSRMLAELPGGLAAPRCFEVMETPGEAYWLWLEDITDEGELQWPLERFGVAAYHLGYFNGSFLLETIPRQQLWMSQRWLRAYITESIAPMAAIRAMPDHPLIRRLYPDDLVERLLQLWAEREIFLQALERLPQTLCHMDAFRRNLFSRRALDGREQTVAIDWAFAGMGALGEELVPLVTASVGFFGIEVDRLRELEEVVFERYLAGLRDAGWRGDPRLVRFAYAAASGLRFGLPPGVDPIDANLDPWFEQMLGRPMEEILHTWVILRRFLFDLADEARDLLGWVETYQISET